LEDDDFLSQTARVKQLLLMSKRTQNKPSILLGNWIGKFCAHLKDREKINPTLRVRISVLKTKTASAQLLTEN
jgi:hypothetical protein